MDAASSRFIRINHSSIGLIGLDMALNTAAEQEMEEQQAADFLFQEIRGRNYIPPGSAENYREALLAEYRKHCNLEEGDDDMLVVRIFGSGCVSCNGLQTLLIEVLDRMNRAADIEQIHDPDEIGRAGILMTPALMINGKVKSSGLIPTQAQVEQWLREIIA